MTRKSGEVIKLPGNGGLAIIGLNAENQLNSYSENPSKMNQQLVLTVLGSQKPELVEKLTKSIRDCGTTIIDSRMCNLGNEFAIMALMTGSWDAIAKVEGVLPKLEKELKIAIRYKRTGQRLPNNECIPYTIEIVCCDRTGVVHDVAEFLTENHIIICELYTNTYQSPYTDKKMFSMNMVVNIPADNSISALRAEFLEFCDQLNFDAVLEPAK